MTQKQSSDSNVSHRPGIGVEPWFLYVVGGLLLVIVAALGGLALRFHRRAVAAEKQLASATAPSPGSFMDLFARQAATVPRLQRAALPRRVGKLDDEMVTVLEVDARQGRALGLRPNDVLRVGPDVQPATRTATQPTSRTGPPPPIDP